MYERLSRDRIACTSSGIEGCMEKSLGTCLDAEGARRAMISSPAGVEVVQPSMLCQNSRSACRTIVSGVSYKLSDVVRPSEIGPTKDEDCRRLWSDSLASVVNQPTSDSRRLFLRPPPSSEDIRDGRVRVGEKAELC